MRWIKGIIYFVIIITLLLLGMLFALRNQQAVVLDVFWFRLPAASLAFWIGISLILGVLIGMLAMTGVYWRKSYQLRRCQQRIKHQEQQMKQLELQGSKEPL